jgi:hypothetical protein
VIEIGTIDRQSDVDKYWDDEYYKTETFVDTVTDTERTSYLVDDTIENIIKNCEAERFVVNQSPETIYDHPESNAKVEVYDGYNE